MKPQIINFTLLCCIICLINSCSVVNGIFKAGMVWGIILVLGALGLIFYFVSRGKK